MKPAESVYLKHIRDSIDQIDGYIEGMDKEEFFGDARTQDAVVRQLQVIGEASKRLSPETRDKHPEIPWSEVTGMRNKLVHDYFQIDFRRVWNTVRNDLAPLRAAVIDLLEND